MEYFLEIGFDRYSKRFEITKEVFEKYNEKPLDLGWKDTFVIQVKSGLLSIKRDELRYFGVITDS